MATAKSFEFHESLTFLRKTEAMLRGNSNPASSSSTTTSSASSFSPPSSQQQSSNPQQRMQQQQQQQQQQQTNQPNANVGYSWMGNATSMIKNASILKTIKDASSKVMDTVQSSINRTDADLTYITSRLIGTRPSFFFFF